MGSPLFAGRGADSEDSRLEFPVPNRGGGTGAGHLSPLNPAAWASLDRSAGRAVVVDAGTPGIHVTGDKLVSGRPAGHRAQDCRCRGNILGSAAIRRGRAASFKG
jgi:hypothetical protein